MAISVNPPPQLKIPPELIKDRQTRDYLRQIEVILFQLWTRTGGVNDDIDEAKEDITGSSSRVSRNAARINSLELKEFEIVNTTTDLTAEEFQIIVCKNTIPITITLDPQAIENDEVHIKRRGQSILVMGSIDGFTNKTINILNYSMHLVFDGIDWSEI
jgi:hypothetical protein